MARRHTVGKGKRRRRNPQHHFDALRKLGADKEAVWEAYHAGKIDSAEMNRRTNAIEKRRQEARDETLKPHYKPGDLVESKWGDKARIEGASRPTGSGLIYSITRGQERGERIYDNWPAEVITKKVAR
jgi:hypothetical protein